MALIPLLLLLVSNATADATSGVFDITKFGAKPNADVTQVRVHLFKLINQNFILYKIFLSNEMVEFTGFSRCMEGKEACASAAPSKVLVPKGTYQLGESRLKGPCKKFY